MSTCNFNNNSNENRPNRDVLYHTLMTVLIMLNGMSVGGTFRNGTDLIKNGYDGDAVKMLVLYLLCAIYTGHTAYKIYQYKKKIDNDHKQR
ncbi:MAG: hypothetical protein J6Q44_00715 [Alphaproteobacteria bacterium]|nr:hypothetical protein [Alphaproteobacteria bacterium]